MRSTLLQSLGWKSPGFISTAAWTKYYWAHRLKVSSSALALLLGFISKGQQDSRWVPYSWWMQYELDFFTLIIWPANCILYPYWKLYSSILAGSSKACQLRQKILKRLCEPQDGWHVGFLRSAQATLEVGFRSLRCQMNRRITLLYLQVALYSMMQLGTRLQVPPIGGTVWGCF